jgi:hypothetical protein
MWVGIGFLVLSWLFPPWNQTRPNFYRNEYNPPSWVGFISIFADDPYRQVRSLQLDWRRLMLVDLSIVVITAGAVYSLRQRS